MKIIITVFKSLIIPYKVEVDRPRLAEAAVEDVVAAIELEAPPRLKLGVAAAPDDDEGVSRDVEVAAGAVNWPAPKRGVEVVVAAEGVAADKPKEVDAVVGFEADGNPKLKPPEEAAVVVVTTDPTFNDEFAAVEATPKLVRGFGAAGVDSALLVVVAAALPKPKENPDGAGAGAVLDTAIALPKGAAAVAGAAVVFGLNEKVLACVVAAAPNENPVEAVWLGGAPKENPPEAAVVVGATGAAAGVLPKEKPPGAAGVPAAPPKENPDMIQYQIELFSFQS